jgi:chromosomal replication initiation ATPase DnaA
VYSIDADLMSGLKKLPRVARMAKYREMVSDFHKENKLGEGRLLLPDRRRHIVVLRWELIYRLKEQLGFTNKELSRLFKMDHTTILHGYRRHKELNGIE